MIQGCTSDYAWCDVQTPNALRGWVYAQYLSHPFQGNPVPVSSMGATIGIPVLTFALGAYWASHYRDRPWYHNQSQWNRPYYPQRPPHRPPPAAPGASPAWRAATAAASAGRAATPAGLPSPACAAPA